MAHKRLFIYAALLAICYLVGVTWAETATQTLPISSSNTNNNASQPIAAVKSVPAAAAPPPVIAPTIAAPKVISSTVASGSKSGNSSTTECACAGALLPQVDANGKELPICAECKCAHVARNTTLIKVVVIIVIWIISILVIYMLFLMCLEPLLNKRVKANNYQEHTNEDDEPSAPPPPVGSNNQELSARANVLNRVGHQQDKWKRQVREQRRHIYDRHTMLN
ncbi:uncharacterized protein CG1161 isoform X2 [Drosophila grimshawi]|uniref:GH17779 n=1 Tax=Drosophila grimshawi TaxID=7222 RepID=B4JSN5_DROGR|nr:uncharacterized protein CG1161 isoform X2 [Drosophila grimshawi]EDV94775.1 GH17779 [Drosophila grimshawi]